MLKTCRINELPWTYITIAMGADDAITNNAMNAIATLAKTHTTVKGEMGIRFVVTKLTWWMRVHCGLCGW